MLFEVLPQALVELITEQVVEDMHDWDVWLAEYKQTRHQMWSEPCSCGATYQVISATGTHREPYMKDGNQCHSQTCVARNQAELFDRAGTPPDVDLERRLADARSWDAVCHFSRVHENCWRRLLLDDFRVRRRNCVTYEVDNGGRYQPISTPEKALAALGLSAKQIMCRMRLECTPQQQADAHRAIVLDDVDAFLDVTRACPRFLLDEVSKGLDGRKIYLPAAARSTVQLDPRVAQLVHWLPEGAHPRVLHVFNELYHEVNPPNIRVLLGEPAQPPKRTATAGVESSGEEQDGDDE